MVGDHDSPGIVWNSGLATTMFEVTEGADGTPDLGVLRVCTPIAAAGNGNAARDVCWSSTRRTATARWSVAREPDPDGSYYDEVQVSCAFVVGPHNQDTLESFALWCVREQIAVATAHIRSGDVAEAVAGVYSRYTGFPAGDDRVDRHPVVSFAERVVQPGASLSADGLAEELLCGIPGAAGEDVRRADQRVVRVRDGLPLTCETPFSWDLYPHGVITHMRASDDDPEDKPLTALIESEITAHPVLGNGLRITVHVPRDPRGHAGRALNAVNRLDAEGGGGVPQLRRVDDDGEGARLRHLPSGRVRRIGGEPAPCHAGDPAHARSAGAAGTARAGAIGRAFGGGLRLRPRPGGRRGPVRDVRPRPARAGLGRDRGRAQPGRAGAGPDLHASASDRTRTGRTRGPTGSPGGPTSRRRTSPRPCAARTTSSRA